MGNKKFSFSKRLLIACAMVALLTAAMAVSAFATGYGVPASVTADSNANTATVAVTGAGANQITIVVRTAAGDWVGDPNANVLYIDQVTGQGATTNVTFGLDPKWKSDTVTYKLYVGGSGMDVASADFSYPTSPSTLYTVTFKDDLGNVVGTPFSVPDGTVLTPAQIPAVPVKAGYDGVWSPSTANAITAATIFTANYTKIVVPHTVTFKDDAGAVIGTITVNEGDKVPAASVPTIPDKPDLVGYWTIPPASDSVVPTNVTITENTIFAYAYKEVPSVTFISGKIYDPVNDGNLGQAGKVLIEGTLSSDNGQYKVTIGGADLLYSPERNRYIGLVDASAIVGATIDSTKVSIDTATAPTTFTYGDLNNKDGIDNTDLSNMKNWLSKRLAPAVLIAADLNASGTIDNTDLSNIKNWLSKRLAFPALSK